MTTQVMPAGSKIIRKASTKVTKDAEESAEHTLALDFTGCSVDDVLEDASRSAVIRWQRMYREHPERFPEGRVEVKMDAIYARERVQMTPQERIEANLAKLSPEEREDMIRKLSASLKK